MMKFVVFIRNINVGQTKFPSRLQLEQAFLASGAKSAVSFQSNGTVITELGNTINLGMFTKRVDEYLRQQCNFSEALFIRSLETLKEVVRQNPFSAINANGYSHRYVSYYQSAQPVEGIFPLESSKKDCLVFSGTDQEAYSLAKDINGISGYPTPLLEKRLNVAVTTRSWKTLERLAAKF